MWAARGTVARIGEELAEALEVAGEDSSGVLKIVHFIAGRGGPDNAYPAWPDVKVSLQRIVIRHRIAAADDGDDTPDDGEDSRPAEVLVAEYFAELIDGGVKMEDIKRDDIVATLKARGHKISGGAVNGTQAWKELARRKTASKAENIDKAMEAAARSRNWDAVQAAQEKEGESRY